MGSDRVLKGLSVTTSFLVDDFKNFNGNAQAIEHDRQILLGKLKTASSVAVFGTNPVTFDFSEGRIVFSYSVMVPKFSPTQNTSPAEKQPQQGVV